MKTTQPIINYSENETEKVVGLQSEKTNEETQFLRFYSDEEGICITSSVQEKYGDEPVYFSCRLPVDKFKDLLSRLDRLVLDKQTGQS